MADTEQRQLSSAGRIFAIVLMVIVWLAIILQAFIGTAVFIQQGFSTFGALIQTFSYFTMTTNSLVAIYLAVVVFAPRSRDGQFFLRATVTAAVAEYIAFVSIIHTLLLRAGENPEGLHWFTNNTLHLLVPVLFVIYWLVFAPRLTKEGWHRESDDGVVLSKPTPWWRSTWLWMLYPLAFFIYTLIRGAILGTYPYPFIDAGKLGYQTVFITAAILTITFWLMSLVFVGINRLLTQSPKHISSDSSNDAPEIIDGQ
jgi:hypothetical protein